jgi:hypothetical protein
MPSFIEGCSPSIFKNCSSIFSLAKFHVLDKDQSLSLIYVSYFHAATNFDGKKPLLLPYGISRCKEKYVKSKCVIAKTIFWPNENMKNDNAVERRKYNSIIK